MAESYKAVARLKLDDNDYIERGEDVTEDQVDNWDVLIASESVVTEQRFAALFPETVLGANQAPGTPSNLEQIEGTAQQVNMPPDGGATTASGMREVSANPADPPPVEGATVPGREDETGQDNPTAEDTDPFQRDEDGKPVDDPDNEGEFLLNEGWEYDDNGEPVRVDEES